MVWTQTRTQGGDSHFLSATGGVEEGEEEWGGRWLGPSSREHLWSSILLPWKRERRSKKPSSPIVSRDPGYSVKKTKPIHLITLEKGFRWLRKWRTPEGFQWNQLKYREDSVQSITPRFRWLLLEVTVLFINNFLDHEYCRKLWEAFFTNFWHFIDQRTNRWIQRILNRLIDNKNNFY